MQDQYTTNTPPNQDAPETLYDVSPTGKVRPWRLHRLESEQLAEAFWTISARMPDQSQAVAYALRGDRVSACATGAVFEVHKDRDLQYLTLTHANFCRDRLCPMCQWRRSLKMGAQARAVVDECDRVKMSRDGVGYRWMLLTLTQANVDEVRKTATDPNVKRLVGTGEDMGRMLGLDKDWSYRIIKQVGNYGESWEKYFGPNSPLNLPRGMNKLWTQGGLMYAMPIR